MATPDEPTMSRSLSMAEFIDQIGIPGETIKTPEATTPPKYVPPTPPPPPPLPPPSLPPTPGPKSSDLEDDVFVHYPKSPNTVDKGVSEKAKDVKKDLHSSASEEDSTDVETEDDYDRISDYKAENDDPGIESDTASDVSNKEFKRTFSEPIPRKISEDKGLQKQELKGLEVFETKPLKSRPVHKPLFNLASFGRKKKQKRPYDQQVVETERVPVSPPPQQPSPAKEKSEKEQPKDSPSKKKFHSPKKDVMTGFFRNEPKSTSPKTKESPDKVVEKEPRTSSSSSSFFRRDRSRSPVSRKSDRRDRWSKDQFCEVGIDVPKEIESPKKQAACHLPIDRPKSLQDVLEKEVPLPPALQLPVLPKVPVLQDEDDNIKETPPPLPTGSPPKVRKVSKSEESESFSDVSDIPTSPSPTKSSTPIKSEASRPQIQAEVFVEPIHVPPKDDDEFSEQSFASDSSPPYSPAIKVRVVHIKYCNV
jgi:hypothetical protein